MQEWDLLQWELRFLRKKLEEIGLKPEIKHVAVADIPKDADVVVTNVNLEERSKNVTRRNQYSNSYIK